MKKIISFVFLICLLFPFTSHSQLIDRNLEGDFGRVEISNTKEYQSWAKFMLGLGSSLDGITRSQTLVNYLFNELVRFDGSLTTFHPTIGGLVPINVGIILGLKRTAIKNFKIDKSYTVIDRFKIGVSASAYYTPISGVSLGGGGHFYIDLINVRQVTPKRYTEIFPIAKIKKLYKKIQRKFSKKHKLKSKEEIKSENEEFKNLLPEFKLNSTREAYFGKLWNPITQVFKLPLNYRHALRLEESEIMSYSVNGGVELGACFGLATNCGERELKTRGLPQFGRKLVSVSVFFKGKHQISVLKEAIDPKTNPKGTFVQVKLSKMTGGGFGAHLGSTSSNPVQLAQYEGNFIVNLISGIVYLHPFSMDFEATKGLYYDQIFRYDLSTKKGKKAYNKAAFGSFKLSDKYARKKSGKLITRKNTPVRRLLTKREKRSEINLTNETSLFLLRFYKHKKIRNSVFDIEDDLGLHKSFETTILNERQRSFLFGFIEQRSHHFRVHIDKDSFLSEKKPDDSLSLVIKVKRGDSLTNGKEYMDYVLEVENSLDLPRLFPYPPLDKSKGPFRGSMGATIFEYNLKLNRSQLEKFVNYPKKKMWKALETAFDIKKGRWTNRHKRRGLIAARVATFALTLPASALGFKLKEKDDILVANIKHERWKRLRKYLHNPKKLAKKLGKFFDSGDYGPEIIRLLRVVLKGEKIPYSGVANAHIIDGSEDFKFGDFSKFTEPSTREELFHFENHFKKMRKKGIRLTKLQAKIIGGKYFKISFNLNKSPKNLFFSLEKAHRIVSIRNENIFTKIFSVNKFNEKIKKGSNTILFNLNDKTHPLYEMGQSLKVEKSVAIPRRYRIEIAATSDNKNWGLVDENFFTIKYINDKDAGEELTTNSKPIKVLCHDKYALPLIMDLKKRPIYVCLDSERKRNGVCKKEIGFTPYNWGDKNKVLENISARDEWINEKCARMSKAKLKKELRKYNFCGGRSGKKLIRTLILDHFFICSKTIKRDSRTKLCPTGYRPYTWPIDTNRIKKRMIRDKWLKKNCGSH